MELESIRKTWERLDKRMQESATFNQRLVDNIISSRVMTTVDKIKRLNNFFFAVLIIEAAFLMAVFAGNPFDFMHNAQFVPYVLLLLAVIVAFFNVLNTSRSIHRLSPGTRLDHYLKGVVTVYDRNKRFEKWFAIIFLSIGLVIPFSFLPNKIESLGLMKALVDTAVMIVVTVIIYALAFRFGAFKNPYKASLEKDLEDWQQLSLLAGKMDDGN